MSKKGDRAMKSELIKKIRLAIPTYSISTYTWKNAGLFCVQAWAGDRGLLFAFDEEHQLDCEASKRLTTNPWSESRPLPEWAIKLFETDVYQEELS